MIKQELQQRASDKAFARMSMLYITIEQNKQDIRQGNYGGVTSREMDIVLNSNKTELKVWEYITKLIETDETNK
mgnify:CR=1 FL=1|tara:strand:+ start:782 stop:1003 length:222 start_codon:yes stop_codon:yes gene_type:complete